MCITIVYPNKEEKFKSDTPLELQLADSNKILVNYDPKDESIGIFLREVERLVKQGVDTTMNITVSHNNHINGSRTKKSIKNSIKNIQLNEIIKKMVNMHSDVDNKLEELYSICNRK